MIKVKVKIIRTLIKPQGKDEFTQECKGNTTVIEYLKELKYNERHIPFIMATVNGVPENHKYVLKNNDSVVLATIVGGG